MTPEDHGQATTEHGQAQPIVDPEGEWLYVPVSVAVDQNAAIAYASDYWPDKPCYEPCEMERFALVSYDDADEDGRATLDEWGETSLAVPCGNGQGSAYWPIHCYSTDSGQATELEAVYAERNAVVLAFAHMAELQGWEVGKILDPEEPEWPVLMIDTPAGQVSWHFKAEDMPETMPDYPGVWDGHSTPEKYARLRDLVAMGWGRGR